MKTTNASSILRILVAALLFALCPVTAHAADACRTAVNATGNPAKESVRWVVPDEHRKLDDWCRTVGPAVVLGSPPSPATASWDDLVVVTWNVHVGAGDVLRLVTDLRAGKLTSGQPVDHFVLLLQEAYRRGSLVPADARAEIHVPHAIEPARPGGVSMDIVDLSEALGLSLFYAPSMRNGPPDRTDEDRGNAILSTEPLTELSAIELPFERQRRVALGATIQGRDVDGEPWTVRLANAHLVNVGAKRHLWILSMASRLKQARQLLREITPGGNAIVGGDLNTWLGFGEPAYRALASALPRSTPSDRRPTFGRLLRLDHLLFRLPEMWETVTTRLDRFGSDHHPLLALIRMAPERSGSPPPR